MKVLNAKKIGAARSAGFTIIELVVVILLLGILAATALPRFIDVTEDAYDAAVEGVYGGFATGVGLFRAQWVANGQPDSVAISGFGNGLVFTGANTTTSNAPRGYPVGLNATFSDASDCTEVWNGVLQGGRPNVFAAALPGGTTADDFETAVEGISTSTSATVLAADPTYVAVSNNTAENTKTGCRYYYVGRFSEGTSTAIVDIPYIEYTASTGEVSLSTQAFDAD